MSCPTYPANKVPTYVGVNSIPTVLTPITKKSVWLYGLLFVNPNKKSINVTVVDGAGVFMCANKSVPSNDVLVINGPEFMVNGFSWSASAAGLHGRLRYSA